MKKNIFLLFTILILINSISCKKSSDKENNKKYFSVIPNNIFGIDFNNLTSNKVIKILKVRNIPYRGFNPYRDTVKEYDTINSPICIETRDFIGMGIDYKKITRVIYHFEPFHYSVEIEIEIKNDYYDRLESILKNKCGNGLKKYYEDDNDKYALIWETNPKYNSSIELISIDKFCSLLFYNGFGLKKRDDCFYLLIRSRAKKLDHGEFHPYK